MNGNVKCKHCGTINNVYNGVCSSCGHNLDVTASETVDYGAVDNKADYKEFNRYNGFTSDIKDDRTFMDKLLGFILKVVKTLVLFIISLIPLIGQWIVSISAAKRSTKVMLITFSLLIYVAIISLHFAVSKDIIDLIGKNGTEVTLWEYIMELLPTSK